MSIAFSLRELSKKEVKERMGKEQTKRKRKKRRAGRDSTTALNFLLKLFFAT